MKLAELHGVSLEYPIFDASARSLRKRLVQTATGGQLGSDNSGHVVVKALTDLTFSISSGERVGLVGHNGAGKTTLLGVLSGIYAPSAGHLEIRGKVGSLIGLTLGTDAESTGRENILLRAALLGLSRREVEDRMDEIIDFSELGEFIDMPVRTYSSGMNLRLAFAVATVVRPEILLMDEWLSVGDSDFRSKAQKRLAEMVDDTKVLVLATHSKDLLLQQCTRALWLEHGTIRMDSEPDEVADAYFGGSSRARSCRGPRGLPAKVKEYVCRHWANTRLAFVNWERIHGGAIAALVDLLERQGGFFRLGTPCRPEDEELQRCLSAAWKIITPATTDADAEDCLFGTKPEHAGEILAELVVYQNAKRSTAFWIKMLERACGLPFDASPLRARLEARLAVLRKERQDESSAGPDCLIPLNPLTIETVRRPLDGDVDDATPAPGTLIVAHEDGSRMIVGESILFRECSLTESRTVVINRHYFSASHDGGSWIKRATTLKSVAALSASCRVAFPTWYLDTPNDYLKFTQLIPSILLAAELGDGTSFIFADLAKETLAQLQATASFFGRRVPAISGLEHLAASPDSPEEGCYMLVRASHNFIARLRSEVSSDRWRKPPRTGRKIYFAGPDPQSGPAGQEKELRGRLLALGFGILSAGSSLFVDEIKILSEAETIVAAPGPHLGRIIFCSPECRFLELGGTGAPLSLYAQLAATCGIKSYQQLPLPASAASWPELTNLL